MNATAFNSHNKCEPETYSEIQKPDTANTNYSVPYFFATHLVIKSEKTNGGICRSNGNMAYIERYSKSFS